MIMGPGKSGFDCIMIPLQANDDVTEWTKKVLMDSVTPVIDVKFAPRTWSSADMSPGNPVQSISYKSVQLHGRYLILLSFA